MGGGGGGVDFLLGGGGKDFSGYDLDISQFTIVNVRLPVGCRPFHVDCARGGGYPSAAADVLRRSASMEVTLGESRDLEPQIRDHPGGLEDDRRTLLET